MKCNFSFSVWLEISWLLLKCFAFSDLAAGGDARDFRISVFPGKLFGTHFGLLCGGGRRGVMCCVFSREGKSDSYLLRGTCWDQNQLLVASWKNMSLIIVVPSRAFKILNVLILSRVDTRQHLLCAVWPKPGHSLWKLIRDDQVKATKKPAKRNFFLSQAGRFSPNPYS